MSAIDSIELRQACEIRSGGTPSKSSPDYWRGDTPWVSPKDMKSATIVNTSDHISEEALRSSAASLAPAGSTLVVVRSGVLVHSFPVATITRPMSFNQDIKALTARSNSGLTNEYLFWFLRGKAEEVVTLGVKKGATVHSLKAGYLESLRIPLRPIDAQRGLTDRLQRAEGILRLRHEAQRKAAELIPALFLDRFGDPASNPKGWPMHPLGNLLAACDYGTSRKASIDGAGIPVLRMGNVDYAGDLDLTDLKHVELDPGELSRQALRPGDLLFNRTNSKELVGKTGLWDGRWPAVAASYFIRLRVQSDLVLPEYIWAAMNSKHMKRVLFATARGAIGQANINTQEIKALELMVPPLDLQRRFVEELVAVRSIQAAQNQGLRTAQATFDALLHQAFPAT